MRKVSYGRNGAYLKIARSGYGLGIFNNYF